MCSLSKRDGLCKTGRYGRLNLVFKEHDGKTELQDSYAAMPMHFLPPFYPDGTGWAYACLVNPTGGFVGGDRIEIDIILRERCHLVLTAQSAAKIYRSAGSSSSQAVNVEIRGGAAFEYLPGLVIPFAGSRHRQTTKVHMEKGSRAFIVDSFATGRVARGEYLAFEDYENSLEIEYDGEILVLDKLILRPETTDYSTLGLLETRCVSSVVYVISDDFGDEKALAETLHNMLQGCEGILGGVSALWSNGLAVRLLGSGARHLERAVSLIWSHARSFLFPGAEGMADSNALYRRIVGC